VATQGSLFCTTFFCFAASRHDSAFLSRQRDYMRLVFFFLALAALIGAPAIAAIESKSILPLRVGFFLALLAAGFATLAFALLAAGFATLAFALPAFALRAFALLAKEAFAAIPILAACIGLNPKPFLSVFFFFGTAISDSSFSA
tara:strand:+ start:1489 stop:1923 length:435 start_codon:yes stop_codon:yes gene_type:complete